MKKQGNEIADRLDRLFKSKRKENGDPFTYKEIEQLSGVSASYIYAIRTGTRENPKPSKLRRISVAFGESPLFFEHEDKLQLQDILQNIKKRGDELTSPNLEVFATMIDKILDDLTE